MVHNDVHDDTDTLGVSGIDKSLKFRFCAVVCIGFGIVCYIVAVIGIVSEVVTKNITVELLIGSGQPDGINA